MASTAPTFKIYESAMQEEFICFISFTFTPHSPAQRWNFSSFHEGFDMAFGNRINLDTHLEEVTILHDVAACGGNHGSKGRVGMTPVMISPRVRLTKHVQDAPLTTHPTLMKMTSCVAQFALVSMFVEPYCTTNNS
jgi:hypothetical protein